MAKFEVHGIKEQVNITVRIFETLRGFLEKTDVAG